MPAKFEENPHGVYVFEGDRPYGDVYVLKFDEQRHSVVTKDVSGWRDLVPDVEGDFRSQSSLGQAMGHTTIRPSWVRNGLRDLIQHVFTKYNLPMGRGVEIGSGPLGYMFNNLMPANIDPASWKQVEINPHSVDYNRARHPEHTIIEGTYSELARVLGGEGCANIITGLSSLDGALDMEKAVLPIRQVLPSGGYLFHTQDIQPAPFVPFDEMEKRGERSPFTSVVFEGRRFPELYIVNNGTEAVSTVDLFRSRLRRAIATVGGFDVEFDGWITVSKGTDGSDSRTYSHGNTGRFIGIEKAADFVSAAVTVARRR